MANHFFIDDIEFSTELSTKHNNTITSPPNSNTFIINLNSDEINSLDKESKVYHLTSKIMDIALIFNPYLKTFMHIDDNYEITFNTIKQHILDHYSDML